MRQFALPDIIFGGGAGLVGSQNIHQNSRKLRFPLESDSAAVINAVYFICQFYRCVLISEWPSFGS